ncbi:MAG: nucleotidyltransferase [Acidobacteriota bacterium]|nr:nucleotidyltransferase [Acidobacteriota bacterium]
MKPTLVVLAAGIGSRYGSLKQVDRVGPSGETIIDYSIYDALRAGFGKAVFIIRRDIEAEFREVFLERLGGRIPAEVAFQELADLPEGFRVPAGRTKPWGTSHAVLAAASQVREPFAVINADDFYGRDAFALMAGFLGGLDASAPEFAVVGYGLRTTLSEHGSVARGVCEVGPGGLLAGIVERLKIEREGDTIVDRLPDGRTVLLPERTVVSMNFWGFTPLYFERARAAFTEFLKARIDDPKAEMYIPLVVNDLVKSGQATVKVLPTTAKWFGVTYREDKPRVMAELETLVQAGEYPRALWK